MQTDVPTDPTEIAGGLLFQEAGDGTCSVVGAGGYQEADLVIPSNAPGGSRVVAIEKGAFQNADWIRTVTIPEGVTSIEEGAFMGCAALRSVEIPEGIPELEPFVFAECVSLKDVKIPHSVSSMGVFSFYACAGMERILIPDGITQILENVFDSCTSLKDIVYDGTISQWQSIYKRYEWASGAVSFHVICTDGEFDEVFDQDRYASQTA